MCFKYQSQQWSYVLSKAIIPANNLIDVQDKEAVLADIQLRCEQNIYHWNLSSLPYFISSK